MVDLPVEGAISSSFPLDSTLKLVFACVQQGWFNKRSYHHTGMVSTWYAMREALAIVGEEGLGPMWARHKELHHQVRKCLKHRMHAICPVL